MSHEPASDLDGFLDRFLSWGAAPTLAGYVALLDPNATLRDPGADEPLIGAAIRRSIETVLTAMADFRLAPVRVGRGEATVFVEAVNTGTLAGVAVRWDAVYCIAVRDGHVAQGRRYYDRAALHGPLLPQVAEWPDLAAGPIHLEPGVVGHAADGKFREWTGTVAVSGVARPFGMIERFAAGEHRWFFDRISLRPAAAALVEQIGAVTL